MTQILAAFKAAEGVTTIPEAMSISGHRTVETFIRYLISTDEVATGLGEKIATRIEELKEQREGSEIRCKNFSTGWLID